MKTFRFLLTLVLFGTTPIFGENAPKESLQDPSAEKNELLVPQDSKEMRPVPKKLKTKKSKLNSDTANPKAIENDAPPAPPVY